MNKQGGMQKNPKFSTGKDLRAVLLDEAEKLKKLIQKYIDAYYSSYSPSLYTRTYDFQNSLRIETVKQEGTMLSVKIYFDPTLATHPSVFGQEDGFVPILINDGWQWKNGKTEPYRFARYEGYQFVEKAIDEYNKNNDYGFTIRVVKKYKNRTIQDKSY